MKLLAHYLHTLAEAHPEIVNWRENHLNDSLFYSCRETQYDRTTFPSRLHYHDYYELVIFGGGDIHYVCEDTMAQPKRGDIILIPPHRLHMSVISAASTVYRRHVFYLYPDALDAVGGRCLLDFLSLSDTGLFLFTVHPQSGHELSLLLPKLDRALKDASDPSRALSTGLVLEIFYYLNDLRAKPVSAQSRLPRQVLEIQRYIDSHYTEINSVSDIASRFYYSREYISRLFRRHFNMTVAEYITQRRIAQSQALISGGMPLSDACFQVGFGSLSTFIRAFKSLTNMTPGQYKASCHGSRAEQ